MNKYQEMRLKIYVETYSRLLADGLKVPFGVDDSEWDKIQAENEKYANEAAYAALVSIRGLDDAMSEGWIDEDILNWEPKPQPHP